MVVNSIVVMEVFYLFSVRYTHGASITWRGLLGTPAVLTGITAVVILQLTFSYAPFMTLPVVELEKRVRRRWQTPVAGA